MATYKLIQDIEAEDHILGPLSLRQFIFALVAVFCFYMSFIALTKNIVVLLVFFLPPGLFCAFFAFPFGRDQPTEVWALAKLRFLFKPRRRVWDQSGMKELVTITAPKKIETVRTNGLSQTEVNSRLKALANTIDSRGWAIKNVNISTYSPPNPLIDEASDRLIDVASMPQEVPSYEVLAADDILDETSNPIAQQFDHMISESSQAHHQQLVDKFRSAASQSADPSNSQPVDYWFMNQPSAPANPAPGQAMFMNSALVQPGGSDVAAVTKPKPSEEEVAITAQLKAQNNQGHGSYSHLRTLQPLGSSQAAQPAVASQQPPATPAPPSGTPPPDPAILSLVNNNDLNVATIAREAEKATRNNESPDEVVISLH